MKRFNKKGLRIAWHNHVERFSGRKVEDANGAGWYIETWMPYGRKGEWKAIIDLRFLREQDAMMAMHTLTRYGIDSYAQLTLAGLEKVSQLACLNLQW